jgi:hypothetical protein
LRRRCRYEYEELRRGVGHSDPAVRFVDLRHYVIKSVAYRTLPYAAKALLTQVWLRHNGVNNGGISYGCNEAEEIEMSNPTATRMFAILIERGFLVATNRASFTAKNKKARTWRITAEPSGGQPATMDFMSWRPAATEAVARKDFTASPMKPDSFTSEAMMPEKPVSASPVKPTTPILATPQLHQRSTYNLPCSGRTPLRPLRADWKPGRRATVEARVEGLPLGRVHEVMILFRQRYVGSGVESRDWLGMWRNFVREILENEEAEKKLASPEKLNISERSTW